MCVFEDWELYVYGEFHVKCEIMFDECALQMKAEGTCGETCVNMCSVCNFCCSEQFVMGFFLTSEVFSPEVVWAHHL